MRVVAALQTQDYLKAEALARKYLSANPTSIRAHYNLSIALSRQAEVAKAKADDERLAEASKQFNDILGRDLFILLRLHEAISDPVGFVLKDPGLQYLFNAHPQLKTNVEAYRSQFQPDMGTETYGAGCFAAGTRVLMANGKQRPIEKIAVGDAIASYDDSEEIPSVRVVCIGETQARPIILNRAIRVSPSQPLRLTTGAWVQAGDLRAGDCLFSPSETAVTVESVEDAPGQEAVYWLEVTAPHTYCVGTLLAHNKMTEKIRPFDSSGDT